MDPKALKERREQLEAIAGEDEEEQEVRISALCSLYFLHQGDVRKQAQYVRQIQDLV
jgi:hypothetical protein